MTKVPQQYSCGHVYWTPTEHEAPGLCIQCSNGTCQGPTKAYRERKAQQFAKEAQGCIHRIRMRQVVAQKEPANSTNNVSFAELMRQLKEV